jgi:hypothetical protein
MERTNCAIRGFDSQVLHAKVSEGSTWSDIKSKPRNELANAIVTLVATQEKDTLHTNKESSKDLSTNEESLTKPASTPTTVVQRKEIITNSEELNDDRIQSNKIKDTNSSSLYKKPQLPTVRRQG